MTRYPSLHRPLLASGLLLSLLLVACDRNTTSTSGTMTPDRSTNTTSTGAAGGASAPMVGGASTTVADASISEEVKARLATDSGLAAAMIQVDTVSGRTALQGKVADGAARDRAGQLAASVKGVDAVDNRLEVTN